MDDLSTSSAARAGRPTREQAAARHDQLLETALDHFLEKGFELTTIEAIAQDVGMTKRTVYARYPEKVALFRAAVKLAIERYTVSQAKIEATDRGGLEQTLIAIAWLRIEQVLTPNGLKLQRIINSENYRFPEIFVESYEQSGLPTVRFLEAILRRESRAGHLALDDPASAANVFMSMVVGGPVRSIVLGVTMSRDEIDQRVRFAVQLFLNGVRPR